MLKTFESNRVSQIVHNYHVQRTLNRQTWPPEVLHQVGLLPLIYGGMAVQVSSFAARLYHLQPMLDEHGLIIIGGTLDHAPIPALQKHILGITHLARIIVTFYHISNYHAGATTLLSVLSGQFYITSVRRLS